MKLPRPCAMLIGLLGKFFCGFVICLVFGRAGVLAEEAIQPGADKSCFTLLNPTPPSLMRAFETDRPDKTESPYTIDAGHFAIELGLVTYAHTDVDRGRPNRTKNKLNVAESNLKLGLLNNTDFEIILQPFLWQQDVRRNGQIDETSGFGDMVLRLKTNLWGNDGGTTALAVLPFVTMPTNQVTGGNEVGGGLLVPLEIKGPYGWDIGLMSGFEIRQDEPGADHETAWINSIVFEHDLFMEKLEGYAEFFSDNTFNSDSFWDATADFGLMYLLTNDVQLDAGINVGLTEDADDISPFIGVSMRF